MLNCKQFVSQNDELLSAELPFYRKLHLRLHLLMCRHCRRYARQSKLLTSAIKQIYHPASADKVNDVMRTVMDSVKDKDQEQT